MGVDIRQVRTLTALQIVATTGILRPSELVQTLSSSVSFTRRDALATLLKTSVWSLPTLGLHPLLFAAAHNDDPEEQLAALISASEKHSQSDLSSGSVAEILRDVGRTFPGHPLFANKWSNDDGPTDSSRLQLDPWTSPALYGLMRILVGFSIARPGVGYAQGMNYVAATALMLAAEPLTGGPVSGGTAGSAEATSAGQGRRQARYRSPEDTLADALRFMLDLSDHYGCADLWRAQLPRLPLLGYTLSECARRFTPLLHEHLTRIGFTFEVFAAQWLLPLGSTMFPLSVLRRVWLVFVAYGWKALFRVCVAILARLEPIIVDRDMDAGQVAALLRDWKDAIGQVGKKARVLSRTSTSSSVSEAGLTAVLAGMGPATAGQAGAGGQAASGGYTPEVPISSLGEAGAQAALLARYPSLDILFTADILLTSARGFKITRTMLTAIEERFAAKVLEAKVDKLLEQAKPKQDGVSTMPADSTAAPMGTPLALVPLLVSSALVVKPSALQRMRVLRGGPQDGAAQANGAAVYSQRSTTRAFVAFADVSRTPGSGQRSRAGSASSSASQPSAGAGLVATANTLAGGAGGPGSSRPSRANSIASALGSTVGAAGPARQPKPSPRPGANGHDGPGQLISVSNLPSSRWLSSIEGCAKEALAEATGLYEPDGPGSSSATPGPGGIDDGSQADGPVLVIGSPLRSFRVGSGASPFSTPLHGASQPPAALGSAGRGNALTPEARMRAHVMLGSRRLGAIAGSPPAAGTVSRLATVVEGMEGPMASRSGAMTTATGGRMAPGSTVRRTTTAATGATQGTDTPLQAPSSPAPSHGASDMGSGSPTASVAGAGGVATGAAGSPRPPAFAVTLADATTLDLAALARPGSASSTGPSSSSGGPKPCPTSLDNTQLFQLVLRALAADVLVIDSEASNDASLLTAKANVAREKAAEASAAAKAAHGVQEAAESRLQELLSRKKSLTSQLHAAVVAGAAPGGAQQGAKGSNNAAGGGAISILRSPLSALMGGGPTRGGTAVPTRTGHGAGAPGPGHTAAAGEGTAASTEAITASSPVPATVTHASISAVDMATFSSNLAALDEALAEAGSAWKTACWQATLADTRCEELTKAADALMRTLVEAAEARRARRTALMVQAWRTLSTVWRVHVQPELHAMDAWQWQE